MKKFKPIIKPIVKRLLKKFAFVMTALLALFLAFQTVMWILSFFGSIYDDAVVDLAKYKQHNKELLIDAPAIACNNKFIKNYEIYDKKIVDLDTQQVYGLYDCEPLNKEIK